MLAVSYGTVSDIEILWTLIALGGMGFGVYNIRDAWLDRKAIISKGTRNGRRRIATFAVRGEAARTYMQTIFALIGVLAMLLPEAPTPGLPIKLVIFGAVFRWGLITVALVCLLKSIDSWYLRRKLNE